MQKQQSEINDEFSEFTRFMRLAKSQGFEEEDLNVDDYDDFKQQALKQYNMNEEAIRLLWEQKQENKLKLFTSLLNQLDKQIEPDQIVTPKNIDPSQQLIVNRELQKLAKLKQGKLKDLRHSIEQTIAEMTGQLKHQPRYKPVKVINQDNITFPLIDWSQKELVRNGQQMSFVGLDKFQPLIEEYQNLFEFTVNNNPGQVKAIEQRKKTKDEILAQKIQKVQDQNRLLQKEKEAQYQAKEEIAILKQQNLNQRNKAQQQQQVVKNFLKSQDKQENIQRQVQIDDYKRNKAIQAIETKSRKVNNWLNQKYDYQEHKLFLRQQLREYEQNVQEAIKNVSFGFITFDEFRQLLKHDPLPQEMSTINRGAVRVPKTRKQLRIHEQMEQLEQKHIFEIRLLIEREQLAEENRQLQIRESKNTNLERVFEQQRSIAYQRIQTCFQKQKQEMDTLIKLYN